MTTWLITGASSGLGQRLAEEVLGRGHRAVITARDPASLTGLTTRYPETAQALPLDLTDREQTAGLVAAAEHLVESIDILVNNAGHAYRSAVEEGECDAVDDLFATNLFGPIELIKAALPGMRERRTGTIVNISSIAAYYAGPASGYYSATKSALSSVSDALRREVEPLGITVLTVEPGALRTDFAGRSIRQPDAAIDDYAQTAGLRRRENDTTDGTQPGDPARAATVIVDAATSTRPPARLLLGSDAVDLVTGELATMRASIADWEHLSRSTDFPPAG